ncbi:MAG: radical SAM protein [Planctomycetota bacterium]|nr:radical SAM protein [Planctomycetota bacterium]
MIHAIHDFSAKLRQPSVIGSLETYVAWRQEVRAAREGSLPEPPAPHSAPVSINLDLTTACNYKCTHCIDWDILNTKHRLIEADLRASIAHMAEHGLRSVILIGGGEPTLYPGFVDFVGFLKDLDLSVAVVSNGSRGDRLLGAVERMDERDWIRLSLDSGSNELFIAMHQPNGDTDLDEICSWAPKWKAANPKPRIGFSYIIVWQGATRDGETLHENIHEIALAAERAKEAEFDYISFKPVLERQEDGAEVMDPARADARLADVLGRIRGQVGQAQELADDGFEVYVSTNLASLEDGTWKDLAQQPQTCHMQALRQVLTPLGLYNCPAHRGVDKARIADKDAYADGEKAEATGAALGDILNEFDASHECREVTCLYHDVNWWIEDLIAGKAELVPGHESRDHFL